MRFTSFLYIGFCFLIVCVALPSARFAGLHSSIAQMVEHQTFNLRVESSILSGRTSSYFNRCFYLFPARRDGSQAFFRNLFLVIS